MVDWNPTELERIATTREIEVSSLREDGALTKPVTIWCVRVEGELYIRSVRGDAGGWYKDAEGRHEGRIEADSTAVDVTFEDLPHYPSNPVDSITTDAAKATTIRVVPR